MTDFDPEAADKYSFFFGQNSQKILHFSSFRSRGCPPRFWGYSTFPCRRTSRPPRRPLTRWPASCSRYSASTFLPWRSSPLYTLWPAWRSFQLCCPTSTSGWCCGQTSLRTRRISTTTTTTSIRLLTTCTTAKDGRRSLFGQHSNLMTQADLGLLKESSTKTRKLKRRANFSPVAFSGTLGLKLCVFLCIVFINF